MKKANGFLAIRFVLALCALMACVMWAAGQHQKNENARFVSSPEELRDELLWVQYLASLNTEEPFIYDAGRYTFVPDGSDSAATFAEGLVCETEGGIGESWPVTLFSDPVSGETVFLGAIGEEIGRLPSLAGYEPGGVIMNAVLFPPGPVAGDVTRGEGPESGEPERRMNGSTDVPVNATADKRGVLSSAADSGSAMLSSDVALTDVRSESVATNAATAVVRSSRDRVTVYVDRAKGRDDWTGLNAWAGASDGPKRTVRAGLAAARKTKDGNRLVIRGGAYGEGLDVRGDAVSVRMEGNVFLTVSSGSVATSSAAAGEPKTGESLSTTGTVASVSN